MLPAPPQLFGSEAFSSVHVEQYNLINQGTGLHIAMENLMFP